MGAADLAQANASFPRFAVWDQLRGRRGGGIDLSFVRVGVYNRPMS
jgi:hypothetical protein